MSYVTPEAIKAARELDLLSYLKSYEPSELVRCGANEFYTKSHDSLKISNGKWYWWSRGIGGVSALDYLVKVRGVDFKSAVEIISGQAAVMPPVHVYQPKVTNTVLYMPKLSDSCETAKKYLLSRGIDEQIIDDEIARKTIAEEADNHYALFVGYNDEGEPKHCAVRATDGTDFKKDVSGSNKRYSFHLLSDSESPVLRVFESAIDLLSFATLEKTHGGDYKNENLVSVSGVFLPKKAIGDSKVPSAITEILDKRPWIKKVCLHFDNDFAGRRCAEGIIAVLGSRCTVSYVPAPRGKDFNDYLKIKKNILKTERERA